MASQRATTTELFSWFRNHEDLRLFIGPTGRLFVSLPFNGHPTILPVDSRSFALFVFREFYRETKKTVTRASICRAVKMLFGEARSIGLQVSPVYIRVAPGRDGEIYLDLNNSAGDVVLINRSGWEIIKAPIVFFRPAILDSLPKPEPGGSLDVLQDLLSLPTRPWQTALSFLVDALQPGDYRPGLMLTGPEGSGKTLTAYFLKSLIDPEKPRLTDFHPRNSIQMAYLAETCWVVLLDPVFRIPAWLKYCVEGLMRGGWRVSRRGWEEVCFEDARPVIIAGRELPRIYAMDLIKLPPREQSRPPAELERIFQEIRPRVLGALLDRVVDNLRTERR